jgi:hypothetical protein
MSNPHTVTAVFFQSAVKLFDDSTLGVIEPRIRNIEARFTVFHYRAMGRFLVGALF